MNRAELINLFLPLYDEARSLARYVFEGASAPPSLCCAYLVRHAHDLGCSRRYGKYPSKRSLARQIPPQWPADWQSNWHLPEPFNGNLLSGHAKIAFVGLNPSINWREGCPTFSTSVGDWIDYYLDRFDNLGHFRQDPDAKLYVAYQHALDLATTGKQRMFLGTHAAVTEVVHYKAKKPFGEVINREGQVTEIGRTQFLAAALHCSRLTKNLLVRSGFDVVVVVGKESVNQILDPEVTRGGMKDIQGNVYRRNGVHYVTTKHPTGDRTWTEEDMTRLTDGIKRALFDR